MEQHQQSKCFDCLYVFNFVEILAREANLIYNKVVSVYEINKSRGGWLEALGPGWLRKAFMIQGASPSRTFMVSSEQSKHSTASGRPRAACAAAACPRLRGKPSARTTLPGGVCAMARCGREAAGVSGRLAGGDNGGEPAVRRQLRRPAVSRRLLLPEGRMPGVGNHTGLAATALQPAVTVGSPAGRRW